LTKPQKTTSLHRGWKNILNDRRDAISQIQKVENSTGQMTQFLQKIKCQRGKKEGEGTMNKRGLKRYVYHYKMSMFRVKNVEKI